MVQSSSTASPVQDVEQQHVNEYPIAAPETESTGTRVEQSLVLRYKKHLEELGSVVNRHRYRPGGVGRWLYNDLFDETNKCLIETKGSSSRQHVRMGIGQLFDYGALEDEPPRQLALLLPQRPSDDLIKLLGALEIEATYPEGDDFIKSNLSS